MREHALTIDVPNVEGAPETVDELLASGLVDRVAFICDGCDSQIAQLLAVTPFQNKEAESMTKRPLAATGLTTIFVVTGYRRDRTGRLVKDQPMQVQSADAAKRKAQRYADAGGGALATSQTGDPVLGDWDEPIVIAHCGTLPRSAFNDMTEAA